MLLTGGISAVVAAFRAVGVLKTRAYKSSDPKAVPLHATGYLTRRELVTATLVGGFVAAAAPCRAASTLTVGDGDSADFRTIAEALAAAPAGAVITLLPGRYEGAQTVTRSVTLQAAQPGEVTLAIRTEVPYQHVIKVDGPGEVILRNLTIRHYSKSVAENYALMVAFPGAMLRMDTCDVQSQSGAAVGVEAGDAALSFCTLHDCKTHGAMCLGPTTTLSLNDCRVTGNTYDGVLVRDGGTLRSARSIITRNGGYGVHLIDCLGAEIDPSTDLIGNNKGPASGECSREDDAATLWQLERHTYLRNV